MATQIILENANPDIPPMQRKKCVLVIGRFQPVHLGHKAIFDAAKKAKADNEYDAIVICIVDGAKSGKDKKRNPLSGRSRAQYVSNAGVGRDTKIEIVSNAFDAFAKCRKLGYEPMCVVGGKFAHGEEENRAQNYKQLLDKYFTNDGKKIKHKSISVVRDAASGGVAGVSGSKIRAAVKAGKYEDFAEMIALSDPALIKKMWHEMKHSLGEKNV